jgi:hypothetical protein
VLIWTKQTNEKQRILCNRTRANISSAHFNKVLMIGGLELVRELKGFIVGVLVTMLFTTGAIAVFASGKHDIKAVRNEDIQIVFKGDVVTLKDVKGNVVYPISFNGTTYIPVRGVAQLYGDEVGYDSDKQRVLIGAESMNTTAKSGDEYKLNTPVPFEFTPIKVRNVVNGTYYWTCDIKKLTLTKAVLNDKGAHILTFKITGSLANVGNTTYAKVSPVIGVGFEFFDAYNVKIGDTTLVKIKKGNVDGTEVTDNCTIEVPKAAVKIKMVKDSDQRIY